MEILTIRHKPQERTMKVEKVKEMHSEVPETIRLKEVL